jgi:hypothetical protein
VPSGKNTSGQEYEWQEYEKVPVNTNPRSFLTQHLIAPSIFFAAALFLSTEVPSTKIAWVVGILLLIIYLFAFEIVDVDVAFGDAPD